MTCLMRRYERKRGVKGTGEAAPEDVESRNQISNELADSVEVLAGNNLKCAIASASRHSGI